MFSLKQNLNCCYQNQIVCFLNNKVSLKHGMLNNACTFSVSLENNECSLNFIRNHIILNSSHLLCRIHLSSVKILKLGFEITFTTRFDKKVSYIPEDGAIPSSTIVFSMGLACQGETL